MKLEIQAICHKGLVRQNNEDALSIGGILLRDDSVSLSVTVPEDGYFYLLASDGMGGHENGEQASLQTLEGMKRFFETGRVNASSGQNLDSSVKVDGFDEALRQVARDISCRLNDQAATEGQDRPMGCTLSGVIWYYGSIRLINAGDSRVYRMRGGIVRQLTTDDNERGLTGDPQASKLLLNCIGGGTEGRLDVSSLDGKIRPGDILLICSDGLSDMVETDELETVLSAADCELESEESPGTEGLGRTATDLLRIACEHGGHDNISIILARVL